MKIHRYHFGRNTQPASHPTVVGGADIVAVLPAVRHLAEHTAKVSCGHADTEDLFSEGCLAMVRFARDYDPARSSWKTFAVLKARAAMLDWMRSRTLNRIMRRRSGNLHVHVHLDSDYTGCEPTDATRPEDHLATGELCEAAQSILPPQERMAVRLYWLCGLQMWEVGEHMGFSESRASELLDRAMHRMRRHLDGREWEACV